MKESAVTPNRRRVPFTSELSEGFSVGFRRIFGPEQYSILQISRLMAAFHANKQHPMPIESFFSFLECLAACNYKQLQASDDRDIITVGIRKFTRLLIYLQTHGNLLTVSFRGIIIFTNYGIILFGI